jgi:hypothetical protein
MYPNGASLFDPDATVLDYDRDGNDDIVIPTCNEVATVPGIFYTISSAGSCKQNGSEIWKVLRATGDGRLALGNLEPDGPGTTLPLRQKFMFDQRPKAMDANGDGIKDFVLLESPQRQTYQAYLRKGPPTHLLEKVENGLGRVDEFVYRSLTSSAVYSPGSFFEDDCFDTVSCKQPKHPVVSAHVEGGRYGVDTRTTEFRYAGARFGYQGRGWLGFGSTTRIETTTAEPQIHAEWYFNAYRLSENRSFPLVGRPWRVIETMTTPAATRAPATPARSSMD